MKVLKLHPWDVTPAEARQIQVELRERLVLEDRLGRVRRVAGADVAFDLSRERAIAGVIVYEVVGQACSLSSSSAYAMASLSTKSTGYKPVLQLIEIERVTAVRPLAFPYVPGLLSFREAPALLAAFARVRQEPDVVFVDGQGYAHPRRFGIACHLGVLLGKPTVGCAKSRLIGMHDEPPNEAGSWTWLRDPSSAPFDRAQGKLGAGGGETIGAVLRTRAGVKPIYVSQGHRVSLPHAVELVLAVCDGLRIPKPTREADHFVEAVKRRGGKAKT